MDGQMLLVKHVMCYKHLLSHLASQQPSEVGTIIFFIFQSKNLPREGGILPKVI